MGEVYRARDTRLDRTVAIKLLAPALAADPEFRARFEREARAISQVNHPHICTLHDVGESPGPVSASYLVMEYVAGETLAQRLQRGPLPAPQALAYATQIADALDKAHRAGVIHGDLKPGNVMLTRAGTKLLDFGLARRRPDQPAAALADVATGPTQVGGTAVLGTLQYLAPEQLEGGDADERSDIFALGAVLFEMLTGRRAFDGATPAAVIAAIMEREPPRLPPPASAPLQHVVSACLAKEPDERWQHAGDLARELRWIAAAGDDPVESAPAPRRVRPWMWAAAAVAIAAAALAAVWLLYMGRETGAGPLYRTSILLPGGLRFPAASPVGGSGRFTISPDGRRVAFVAVDANGNQSLWVRALDSLSATPLAGTEGAAAPFWSPDSRFIAFVAQGQLKRIEADGGTPFTIAPALNATGSWNADNTIVFTPNAASPLHAVPAAGGTPRPVTALDPDTSDVVHRSASFLPDGRHFLYVAVSARDGGTTGARAVYVGSLDEGDEDVLVLETGTNAAYADGHLLYLRDNMLVAQPFDPSGLALSGDPVPITDQVEMVGPLSGAFSVSASGVIIYQPASGQGTQLVWMDRDGRPSGVLGEPANYGDVDISPDGRRAIVSVLDASTNTRDLWTFDIARGVRTRFTFDAADDANPVWSGDSSRIVFTSNRAGHFDLYEKASSGVGAERLLLGDDTEKYPTSWSSTEDSLLYWTFDEGTHLWVLPLSGDKQPWKFLSPPVNPGRFSPDGRWVAYYSPESGRSEVYVVSYPNPAARWQISTTGGNLPRWRADGKEMYYVGRDNRLMAVPVDTTGRELEVQAPQPLVPARPVGPGAFYDVTPDGQRFLVNTLRDEGVSSSITILQNWRGALGR